MFGNEIIRGDTIVLMDAKVLDGKLHCGSSVYAVVFPEHYEENVLTHFTCTAENKMMECFSKWRGFENRWDPDDIYLKPVGGL